MGTGEDTWGPEEAVSTSITVDSSCEMLALLTYSTPFVVPLQIHGHGEFIDSLVEVAFVRVSIAVARLTLKSVISGVSPPLLLREAIPALVTVQTRCFVLALALQDVTVTHRGADVGVAIAHTTPSNTDLLDGVVVSSGHSVIPLGH